MNLSKLISLPPGSDQDTQRKMRLARYELLEKFKRDGPIVGCRFNGELVIFISGLKRGRQFLAEHDADLRVPSMKLTSMFPEGFLRTLTGSTHQSVRSVLVEALQEDILLEAEKELVDQSKIYLQEFCQDMQREENASMAFRTTLEKITTQYLLRIFFGASKSTAYHSQLESLYDELGGSGLVWYPGPEQEAAFKKIRQFLLQHFGETAEKTNSHSSLSIIKYVADNNQLTDCVLGNLIYMVEMGRFDLRSYFRWLVKYASEQPEAMDKIAIAAQSGQIQNNKYAHLFIKETFRMDQSERLLRILENDIEFEGYSMPKGTTVQVCMWESHKSEQHFTDPLEFNPERFETQGLDMNHFSPFGLDKHRCPLSNFIYSLSSLFLCQLAIGYELKPMNNGEPARGLFHWQPAFEFYPYLSVHKKGV